MNDFRFALRQLFKNPAFTLIAVITLALGIGANTAIFSVVNAVLLKPLPFPAPNELVAIGSIDLTERTSPVALHSLSYPDFFDFRDQNRSFANMALYRDRAFALVDQSGVQSVRGQKVTSEFFDVLGIAPRLGRGFARADEQEGGGPGGFKVVISDGFWQRYFNRSPNALGKSLLLDGRPHAVIGVMPAGFQFPIQSDPVELYVSTAADAFALNGKPLTQDRGNQGMHGVGRLKSGVSAAQANAELDAMSAALEKKYPETNTHFRAGCQALREELVGDVRLALYVLFGAVVCLLLIANANVANLLLARASTRGKEIALRAALGASRGRIIRQLLSESILLAGLGGALGMLIALWGTSALVTLVPQNIPRITEIRLDGTVLLFTTLISLLTGVVFGLVPAWQASRVDLNTALKTGTRTAIGADQKNRARHILVMAEVAIALVLLISAGLLIRTFEGLGRVSSGMRTERLFTARLEVPSAAYPRTVDVVNFFDRLAAKLRTIPGVESASVVFPLPLSGSINYSNFDLEEHPKPEGEQPICANRLVSPDFFTTMGVPVLQGRAFSERDRADSAPVVIINERFAQKYFPGENPIGKRLTSSWSIDDKKPPVRTVIGVVGNVRYRSLREEYQPELYLTLAQIPFRSVSIVIRTNVADAGSITTAVRRELASVDRNLPLTSVRVFEQYIASSLARPRFNALLLSIFAGIALLLTAIGIYGVVAYSVVQRTSEIGIRMALGAARSHIFRLVVGQTMSLVTLSIVIGLVGAFAATRLLNSLLYGVGAADPLTFSAIALLIAVIAFVAAWLPARRASQVDPIVALRAE